MSLSALFVHNMYLVIWKYMKEYFVPMGKHTLKIPYISKRQHFIPEASNFPVPRLV